MTRKRAILKEREPLAHLAYVATLAIKGFDGGLETMAGLVIWITGPQRLYRWAVRVTAPELYEGSHERIAQAIRSGAHHMAMSGSGYIVFYLMVHGLLKLGVAAALLKGGARWIFPAASAVLCGFIAYMSWRLAAHWSNWLLGFALFDALTLALVLNEWRDPAHK